MFENGHLSSERTELDEEGLAPRVATVAASPKMGRAQQAILAIEMEGSPNHTRHKLYTALSD